MVFDIVSPRVLRKLSVAWLIFKFNEVWLSLRLKILDWRLYTLVSSAKICADPLDGRVGSVQGVHRLGRLVQVALVGLFWRNRSRTGSWGARRRAAAGTDRSIDRRSILCTCSRGVKCNNPNRRRFRRNRRFRSRSSTIDVDLPWREPANYEKAIAKDGA